MNLHDDLSMGVRRDDAIPLLEVLVAILTRVGDAYLRRLAICVFLQNFTPSVKRGPRTHNHEARTPF